MRRDKINYYLDIAETVLERSTCLRRQYGSIIVKNDSIVSTGFNGAPRSCVSCDEKGECIREKLNVPRGTRYELCASTHSEMNAMLSASRDEMLGSTLYIAGRQEGGYVANIHPCNLCKKLIINAGIEKVIIRDDRDNYRIIYIDEWIKNQDVLTGENGY